MKRENQTAAGLWATRGQRHRLLLQQRLHQMVSWPTRAIIALSAALFVWGPPGSRKAVSIILLGSAALLVLTLLFRLRAYVQCRCTGLRLQLPFFHMDVPYGSIRSTRPTNLYHLFPPGRLRWTQRSFLRPLFARTVIVVELSELPIRRSWLRRWMSPHMLSPDAQGLVLLVRDWMALHRQLDEWRARTYQAELATR
jgi:hypothetical protein